MTVGPTSGPRDWWARPLRPSDVARGVDAWLFRYTNGGKDHLGIMAALGVVLLWAAFQPLVALTALFVGLGFAGVHAGRAYRADPTRRVTAVAPFALLWILGTVLLALDVPWAATALGLLTAEALARRPAGQAVGEPVVDRWYSFASMQRALITAKVLPVLDDGSLPNLSYKGKMRRDEVGEWQQIDLPAPLTWKDAVARHAQIASSLGLPTERIHIDHEPGTPAARVIFAVLHERKAIELPAAVPDRTDFTQPIPLGPSRLGKPVEYVTRKTHSLLVAKTRAGKSWLARLIASRALLDPQAAVIVFSGKDPKEDWRPMRHLVAQTPEGVEGYVTPITEEADIDRALTTIRFLRQVVKYRGDVDPAERFPLFVVFDEWMLMVETARTLNKQKADEMERQAVMLAASASGLEVHLVFTSQRAVDKYLDSGLLANLGQVFVGLTRKPDEVRFAIGHVPNLLPSQAGEFLVTMDGSTPELVQIPALDDETWETVVIPKASRLRGDVEPLPLLPTVVEPAPEITPTEAADPRTEAVWQVLKRHGVLPTSRIYDLLPEDNRPGGPNVLGRELKAMPGVRRAYYGEDRRAGWEHVPPPRSLPVAAPRDEQPMPLADALAASRSVGHLPPARGSEDPAEAPTGTDGPLPRALRALP